MEKVVNRFRSSKRLVVLFNLFLILRLTSVSASESDKFPSDFLFGAASSAYQIEGGHEAEGKGKNIFDYYTRKLPEKFHNSSNGDKACDSFQKWRVDVKLLKELKVNFYRFSISWSRVLPDGYSNNMNMAGLRYYDDLINELIKHGIQPMITMYHYDLPMTLQEIGGWTNPYIAYHFEDYARILFNYYGDRVKYWITLNADCRGYGDDSFPPFLNQPGIANYLCQHVMLLAHAKAYHLYDDQFRNRQKGKVGIMIDAPWYEPYNSSPDDVEAAEIVREFKLGSLLNPIFHTDGNYPKLVKERVDKVSRLEGYLQSRLPVFLPLEADYVQGTYDFVGLNIFRTFFVKNATIKFPKKSSVEKDMNVEIHQQGENVSEEMKTGPEGARKLLKWVKDKYDDPEIFITGNGFADKGQINDLKRVKYIQDYLREIWRAMKEDSVNVKGYAVWSFLDSFEWIDGYSEKFGLYHVDFSNPNRRRTAKKSATWYKRVIKERRIVDV
ncbi:hypothetical protein JTB14_026869 [Gonioctena quinquepunctata]|nr:hypothetical protein JTB14_026869 [Gonioctena quinquepunctata]